jgi:hypothetical protein
MRRLLALFGVACALTAAMPSVAAASSAAVTDCNAHGRLTHSYSTSELRTALVQMPADVQEYTNCYNIINQALLSQLSGGHTRAPATASGSSSSFLPTPVIVIIVVLALGGATAGAIAIRRRGAGD